MATNSIPNADMDAAFADLGFTFNEGDSKMVVNTPVHQRQPATIAQLKARKRIAEQHENKQMMFKLALEDVSTSHALRTIAMKLETKGHPHMAEELLDLASAAALWNA